MRRIDWIWMFFVIVAVGLVWSWSRTGQRLQDAPAVTDVLSSDRVLEPESPCRPLQAPCAALGRDLALVLGPVADEADLLALRLVVTGPAADPGLPEVDWQGQGEGFAPQRRLSPRRLQDAQWLIALPLGEVESAPSLWVRLTHSGVRYAARFPLPASGVQ